MNDRMFALKLLAFVAFQVFLMIAVNEIFKNSFTQLPDAVTLNEFMDTFNTGLKVNQKLFIISFAISMIIQLWIMMPHKNQVKTNKLFFIVFMIIFILDGYRLYSVSLNNEKYQIEYILSGRVKSLRSLRVRTYLYHYYKIKGDTAGMNLVLNKSLEYILSDDLAYIIEHRKDKHFESIVNQK